MVEGKGSASYERSGLLLTRAEATGNGQPEPRPEAKATTGRYKV